MEKFTSRKFILAVLSAVSGVAISISALPGKIGIIGAIISAIVPAATYIIAEGVVDAKAVGLMCDALTETAEIIEDIDKKDEAANG